MRFSGKKIFIGGFIAVLLIGIPVTVYLLQQQQETRSRAEKSTNVSFLPDSTQSTPLQKKVGDEFSLDVTINPGKNLVSFVKLEIQYDPEKLSVDDKTGFQANTVVFPSVLEGPVYSPGKILVTLSVGPDPTKAIQTTVKAGTLKLKALANTEPGTPTVVTYGATTQVLSLGSSDQASENVLSSPLPAYIDVGNGGPSIPYPSPEPSAAYPSPTVAYPSEVPYPSAEPSAAPSGPPPGPNSNPICVDLTLDRETTGTAPYSVTFGANGNDPDGTISKVTFNFGDGQVSDVTQAGGIGTASVNAQVSHTYNNPGTFQASAILTDNYDGVSSADTCSKTITVVEPTPAGGNPGDQPQVVQTSPQPQIAPTGSTEVALGIGIVSLLLVIGGSLLFFIL